MTFDILDHLFEGSSRVEVESTDIPNLWNSYSSNPQKVLEIAWIYCAAMLKPSNCVEDILLLGFRLDGISLHIDFHGRRNKQYSNQPATEIRVSGFLNL